MKLPSGQQIFNGVVITLVSLLVVELVGRVLKQGANNAGG